MNRNSKSGFTLVELIFVIVIIGVLAAVAVPKFASLKENAEASSVIKVAKDAYTSMPTAYINAVDLQGGTVDAISDITEISGTNWDTATDTLKAVYNDGGAGDVIAVTLIPAERNVTFDITCNNFKSTTTQEKCKDKVGGTGAIISTFTEF